jgi:predicted porin
MKKVYLALIAGVLAITVNAQSKADKAVEFGAKLGIATTNQSIGLGGLLNVSASSKTGFTLGLVSQLNVSPTFAIQPELNFLSAGSKSEDLTGVVTTNLSYVTLPILARYSFSESGFALLAGPQLDFLLAAKAKSGSSSEDQKGSYKSTGFSVATGASYRFPFKLFVDVRYQASLMSVAKASDGSLKNRAFILSVGYFF